MIFKIISLALLGAACWAQGKPICGDQPTTPHTTLVQVSCIDYDALAKYIPFITQRGMATKVLIHAKTGTVVRVTLMGKDGPVTKYEPIIRDSWNRFVAMIQFEGLYTEIVEIVVYAKVE